MVKYCPIMSYQTVDNNELYCMREECALWDEELKQCVIKTMTVAAADKKNGGSSISQQAEYVSGITPTPAVVPNSSGNWVKSHPYRIDCALEKGMI